MTILLPIQTVSGLLGAFSKIDPDGSADGCQNSLGWAAIWQNVGWAQNARADEPPVFGSRELSGPEYLTVLSTADGLGGRLTHPGLDVLGDRPDN